MSRWPRRIPSNSQRFKDPNQWAAPAGNLKSTATAVEGHQHHNVSKLQMIWSQSSGTLRGHEGQPLVIEDVGGKPMMYIESGWPNIVQALDLTDPDQPSRSGTTTSPPTVTSPQWRAPAATRSIVACRMPMASWCSRTLDGFVIALDAQDRQRSLGRQAGMAGQGRDHHARADHCQWQGHHRLRRR